MRKTSPRGVLVAHDERVLSDAVVSMLLRSGVEASGTSRIGTEEVEQLRLWPPRIVLLDLESVGDEAPALVGRLRRACPRPSIVVLGMRARRRVIDACLDSGASGYALHEDPPDRLIAVLRALADERSLPRGGPPARVADPARDACASSRHGNGHAILTRRQVEVVRLIALALTNQEIAELLGVRLPTVKNHVHNILQKLCLTSRFQIAHYAHEQRLIEAPEPGTPSPPAPAYVAGRGAASPP